MNITDNGQRSTEGLSRGGGGDTYEGDKILVRGGVF